MNSLPTLDESCGKNFKYRDLIECGETFAKFLINNVPREKETYQALRNLAENIIDPVCEKFGRLELTYGFSSQALTRKIPGRISPPHDQHSSHEKTKKGTLICSRLGAAADISVEGESSLVVAQWIVSNCAYDRLYFYDRNRPFHVSYGPEHNKSIVLMLYSQKVGRLIPRVTKPTDFLLML